MGVRFNDHSDEQACGKRVPGDLSDEYDDVGGLACARTAGHDGQCESMLRDAARADGVHGCCRTKCSDPHAEWCTHPVQW